MVLNSIYMTSTETKTNNQKQTKNKCTKVEQKIHTSWNSSSDRLWLAVAIHFIASISCPAYRNASFPLMMDCTSSGLEINRDMCVQKDMHKNDTFRTTYTAMTTNTLGSVVLKMSFNGYLVIFYKFIWEEFKFIHIQKNVLTWWLPTTTHRILIINI